MTKNRNMKSKRTPTCTYKQDLFNLVSSAEYNELFLKNLNQSNVNFVGKNNETVLMRMVKNNYPSDFVEMVLGFATDSNLKIKDSEGNTILDYCINKLIAQRSLDFNKIITIFLDKNVLFQTDNLINLISFDNEKIIKTFISHINKYKENVYENIISGITKDNYRNIFKFYHNIQSLNPEGTNMIKKIITLDNNNITKLLNELSQINNYAVLKYIIDEETDLAPYCLFNFKREVLISIIKTLCKSYIREHTIDYLLLMIQKYEGTFNELQSDEKISDQFKFYSILNSTGYIIKDYISLDNSKLEKITEILAVSLTKYNIKYNLFKKFYKNTINHNIIPAYIYDKLAGKMDILGLKLTDLARDLSDYGNWSTNELLSIFIEKIIKEKNYDQSDIILMFRYFRTTKTTETIIKLLTDALSGNVNDVNLGYEIYLLYSTIDPRVLSNTILKICGVNSLLQHLNSFNYSEEVHTNIIKALYLKNKDDITTYYETLLKCVPNQQRYNSIKYIIDNHADIGNLGNSIGIVNYIAFDIENIAEKILNIDSDESIFKSPNYNGTLTPLEKLFDIFVTTKNITIVKIIQKMLLKVKDFSKHTKINFKGLIELDQIPQNIIRKLLNGSQSQNVISQLYGNYDKKTVTIDAMDPLGSVIQYIQKPNYMNTYWKINYDNQSGSDAGGLIKDFYYIIGDKIKKNMTIIDNYFYISETNKNDTELWFRIGLMLGKMFVIEKLPCGINLHPYLLYRITHPEFEATNTITFDENWFSDIDFIRNIAKISDYNEDQWKKYCEISLNEYSFDEKSAHCTNLILDKYEMSYQPALTEFINGFWGYGDSMLLKYFDCSFVGKRVCGSLKYKIFGTDCDCLQKSMSIDITNKYLQGFFNALEKYNVEDNEKLQKLFRFWLGSPYLDLAVYHPRFCYGNKKDVFEAHTCSLELVIPSISIIPTEITNSIEKSTEFMMGVIEATVYNQDLADMHNLHTQYQ